MDSDPRAKPKSGPIDNFGRRSIYINVRRNYLSDFLLAFDYPPPISTMGKRNVSTVPSQALFLLNNEFPTGQARKWANRITASYAANDARIERMYAEAFSRPPTAQEKSAALEFAEKNGWADLAHVLINTTEFLFIR
jgi:Protein of unknown function (DUF1553)